MSGQNAPPDFRQRLENTNSRQGQPVKLIAVVTGNPTPVVQWYREGMEIESSKDFQIAVEGQQHTLTINDPYPEDTGVFLISASNNFGKATSTAHIAIEAASSDEEFTMKTVTSTKKTVTQMESVQSKQSIKKTTKTAISSTSSVGLPPGLNPTEAQKQFASVFSSVGGLKKKKVKKQKVHSSAETEYETVAETETEAQTEVTTEVAFTETEAEMSSVEQVSSSKISPAVPRKPTAAELIKKPQLEIGSPLNKKTQIQGFRSVQAVTGKIHTVSKSKQVDIQINRESVQSLEYGQSKSYTGGVVRHVNAPSGPRSRDASAERFDTDAGVNTDQEEMAVEQVEVEDGGEEVEVASIASTPEPTDIQSELEDVPQEPFAPRFDILPEDTGVIEGDIAVLQATISAWPEPYISWFREGATIEDCPDYQVSYEDGIAQLTIRNCYPDDAGTFTVSARNQMGSTSATCVLSVKSTSEYDREQQQDQFAGGYEESANDTPGSGVECSEPETTDNEELTRTRISKVLSPVGEIDENASLNSPERRGPTSPQQVLNQAMEIVAEAEERLAATSPGAPQDGNLLLPSDSDAAPKSTSPVPGQPRFMTVPDRCILLQEGATQVFEACAPNCHVFWERDGKPIIGGYRVKTEENEKRGYAAITINMVFPEDAGEYVAVAVNRFGRVTHSVYFLTPEHYTAFMRKGGDVPTGLTDYTDTSDNEPRGTTSDSDREGRPMSRGDLNKIKKGVGIKQSASSLTRRTPSPQMRAVSKSPMRGASPSGKGLQNVDAKDLAKVYKPVFLVKAINQEILEGKSARINIRVTGRPPPVMSWFRNGEPVIQDEVRRVTIQENGVESYIIDVTSPMDSAEYTIMAENAGGRAVSSCKLTILPAEEAQRPKILDKPVSTKVNSGESVRLEVFAVGRPTPEICWLKDNQLLQPEKHTNFQFEGVDGHGLLIVEKADKSHDGWYTATAVNKAGRDLCRCKLTVAAEANKDENRNGRAFKAGKGMKKKADASPGRHTGKLTRAPEEFDEKDLYDATQQQKPFFKQKIESIKTTTLGGAHFECRLIPIGDPTMKVQWLLDDKPLDNANRIQTMFEFGYTSLDILNCYPRDTGVISCRATNAHGGTETSATLIVKEDRSTKFAQKEGRAMELISQKEKEMRPPSESPTHSVSPTKEMSDDVIAPQIVSVPEDIETAEGQTMRFHVRATGNPLPKLEWYLNGQQIRKSKRFQLWYDGLHHLEINPARAYDTGSLVAVAVNKVGQAQASCTVDVEPLGDLRSNLKRVEGSSPDAALRAMRMNRKVEGEQQAEVFEEVQLRRTSMNKSPTKDPRKSAAYDADLRAKFKNVRTEEHQMTAARVSVQKKMTHYDQIEAEELLKKTKRELEHWETPEDTPTPTSSKKEGLSHAINVEIPDFSAIKVEAKDEFRPPVITKRLTDTKFDSDQDAKIQVKFNGMPEPELMWFQNGEELSQTERKYWKFIDNHTCELNILKIQKSDEGQYAARVANRAGEELSTCVISITEIKRKILEGPRSQEWNAENTAKFEVVVSHKDMDGEWYKDGVAVDQNEKFVSEDLGSGRRRLTIYNLIKIDEGIYEYVYGGDRAAATLTVHAKPISIVQNLADQVVVASESATFECTLSDVTTDGTWFKNGQPLEQSERHFTAADGVKQILLIENVSSEDIGEYAFAIDEVHSIAQLNLMSNEQQIQIVQHLQAASCLEGSSAEFVCAVEPEQYSNGKWFKNGVELQMDNSRMSYNQVQGGFKELIIRNCTATDNGAYTYVAGNQETVAELQVTEIEILEPLKNQSVDVGGEVLFETLLSHANVQGVWYKNNVPFKISDKSQVFIDDNVQALYLRELTAEDVGIYSFRAGNKMTECELEVVAFDVFKMGLQDLRMKSNETAVFHAELNVELEGAWFRDGQELQMNDRVKSSSSGLHRELVIEDLQRADEGIYTYSTGNADSSATLYVEVAYIIPKNFKDMVVQETSSAEFECEVTKPNLETHWFKDGVEIDPTNDKYEILTQGLSYKLRINNCTVNDNCEVVFLAEDESVAANLQVKPIDIVEDINDEVQAEGKEVTFCCKTSAACQPKWSKDNMILKPRDNKYQIKSDGVMNYLTVKNVNMEDAGSYTCHVGNNESNATLYVEVSQINFVSESVINVQASVEQEMAQIEFQVNKEGVKGKWFHNGIDVNIDNVKYNYVVDRTYHKLIVKQLNVADSGDYTFEANKNLTATASLRVEAKPIAPQWIRQLANAKSELMGNAHFEVEVVGAPTPVVSFYKNGTQITESSKYNLKSSGNVHSLNINCCTEADVCQYTCTAKNSAGSTMTSAQLSIVEAYDMQYEQSAAEQMSVEPPVITRKFESQTSKAGARVVFECEYVGTEPTVRWSKNGNEIQQNNGIQIVNDMHYTALVITSAQHLISGGDYAVEIFNAAGSASNRATLTVQGSPPEVAERPEGGDWQIGESMRLVAKITGEPAPQVHWEYNGKEVNSQRFKIYEANGYAFLELENCEGNDSGKYTVVGENELGQAKWTVTAACRNLTPDATGRPQSASSARSVEVITQKRTTSDGQQVVTNEEVAVATPSPPQANSPPVASPPKIKSPVDVPVQKKATPKLDLSPKPQKKVSPSDVTSPTSPDFVKFDVEEERKKSKVRKTPLKLNIPEKKQDTDNKLKRAPEAMTPLPEQDKPEFIVCPESTDITIGTEAEIACRIAGNPTPEIQWYKGKWGKLAAVGRISIGFNVQSGVSTLNIKKVQKPDKGLYRCVATNKNGSAEAEFTLNVCEKQQAVEKVDRFSLKTKPKVEKEVVSEFDAVKMLRDVDPKEYEKYANHFGVKDFRHLLTTYEELAPEIENDDIEMPEMLLTPESAISMVEEEELWEKAVETIGTKPVDVLQDIRDVVVATHGDAIFEAEIRINVPGIDVKWFKEEKPLHEGDKYSMSRDGDVHSLLIRNVNSDDEGDYRVEAGKHHSSAALKVVLPAEKKTPPKQERVKTPPKQKATVRGAPEPVPVTPPPIQEKVEAPVQAPRPQPKKPVKKPPPPCPKSDDLIIYKQLENCSVFKDSDAEFEAYCNRQYMEAFWEFNGKKITEEVAGKYSFGCEENRYFFVIHNAQKAQEGDLKLTITDRVEDQVVKTEAALCVKLEQPIFITHLNDINLDEDYIIDLECKINEPSQAVDWYFVNQDGVKTIIETSHQSFTIKNEDGLHTCSFKAKSFWSGKWICQMNDSDFETSAQVTVISHSPPPKFLKGLEDMDMKVRDQVVLHVTVSDKDAPVTWYKNGQPVDIDDWARYDVISEGVNRKLIIKKADFDDDGVYEARLPSGTSKAKLSISERNITVEEPLKDLQVPVEGDAIFETVLNCMNAEPAWTKNGQPIKRGPQCQVEEEPHKKGGLYRMTLKACALGDDAKVGFSCAGNQCRQSASFEVMDLPLGFTKELKDIETVEYTPSVTFECHTTRQSASATWYANGRPVEDGGKYNIVSRKFVRKLVVNDLSKKDNYPIKCRITDKGDSAETSGKLATKDEPIEIVGALEDKEGNALSDVTLQAVLDKAGVDYEWYHNDQLIQADKDVEIEDQGECYSLTFKNCPMDRAGKIEFRAARGRVTTACNLTLVEPQLQFVVPLEDQEVGEKEAAEFTVKLSKPIKYLEWTLNAEKLKSGGNITMKADKKNLDHTLYLDEVTKDMEGELAVEAEGVRSTAQLTVTKDLKFTGKLKDTDVVEGEDAVFEATVSNADVPVQWFKNGIEITPDDSRLKIKSEGRKRLFTIPNCSKADEAEYSCKLGDKTSSAVLRVDLAPVKFTKQIMDTGAAEGAVAAFECEVSRDEPVQWFKNGKEKIMDGPKYTMEVDGLVRRLKINDVTYNDEAKFACQVGDAKTVAALAVQTVAIEFVVALEDKTISEGERAEFNIELNVPDVKPIQWFQNGIEMSPKSGIEIKSTGTNHMFAVTNVTMLDTSEIMFNAGGSRSACQLKVTQTPLKFVTVLAENAEAENKMASYELECELNRQNANVKWYLNDKEIFPSRKFAMAVDGAKRILTISDITKDDEGIYHCQADDQKTKTNLKVIPADVKFMTSLEDCSAFERDSFTFEVEISHVNMEGEWLKDGQKMTSGKNIDLDVKGTAHLLTINDCSKSDAGQYKFVVEGKSCECAFTVKDTPAKFVKRLQDESSTEKEEIALSCEVNRPTAEVVWKHNGEPVVADDRVEIVSDGRRRALVIKSVVQADEGDYSCDAGDDETTCTLCVGGRDIRFTKKMIDQEIIEGEKVIFELGLSHDDVEGQWSVNGADVKNSDDVEITCSGRKHTLTLENTKVAQTGSVIFKIASGPKCEARLEVIEAPCTFTAPINDITALENENAIFECQVSKADAEVTWYKGRTKIHMSDKYEMVAVEYKRSLIIKSAGFDDESQFSAQVGDNKCAAKLTITSKVITLSDCFEDQNKTVGETIELTVKASDMGEDAKWMINGIQLKADDNVEFFVDGPVYGLRIKNATLDMAGDVTVSVLNAKHTAALNITDGPAAFTKKLEDVSIENKSKSLELTAELNRGNVNVTWLRDGAEIVPSRKFDIVKRKTVCTLVIADITKEDGAAYTCDCGDEQTVSNVTVVDQNITIVGTFPEEKVVIERETLDIEVEISHEDVEVTWELVREGKDNEVMVASKSCELSSFRTVHNLKVFNCELDLTGTMLFKAGNLVKEIKVIVKEPGARFTKRLADQSATETDAAVFECEISRANAEVEWFLNDVKVEESDKFVIESSNRRRILTINNCSSADEGKVRCSSEDDETLAELQIEGRDIKILKKLSDQEVTEGEEVTFELDVNYADIKGKWTVNEVDVSEGDAYEMAVKGKKQILKIKSTTSENAGLIVWCSGKTKGTANLSVLEAPASFIVQLKDTTAEEKSVCTLEAELNRGNVKTRWLKDRRVPIQTSDKYEIIEDGKIRKLVINDVTYDDEGAYTCDAETAKSNMALTVCARDIKLTAPMRDSTAAEKATGVMSFDLSHSEVSTTWFRNGQKLAKSRLIEMTCEPCDNGFRYSLNIKDMGQDDGGVIAFNAEGIQGEANLEVCATPVDIIDELKRTVCRQGDNITLSVKVSDPLPVGQWFINGVKLARSDRMAIANEGGVHTLKIKNVTTDEMGEAVFVCNNARTSADVIVKDPKVTFSQKLIDQSATEKAVVEFETEVNRINAQIEWVDAAGNVIEESGRFEFVAEGRKRRLVIEGVLLADEGHIKARAAPEYDPLDFANKVRDVQTKEGGEALFDCDVNQPDQAIEWFYDGNKLQAGSKYEFVSDKFRKSLIVKNCKPEDMGFYKAELSNCKTCEAELTVGAEAKANAPRPSYQPEASQEKPNEVSAKLTVKARDIKIRRHLQDQECFEGESVEFQCETSFSDVTPHWTCNGVLLKENGQTVIFEQSGARQRLILKEVQGTQAGAIEFYGKTKANLHVIEQPVDFTEEMEPVSVFEKETAKFHAKVSRANAKVKWFKGRRMLKEGGARYEMISDGCNRLLIIKKSEFNDEKDYTCSCDDAIVTAKLTVNPRDIKMVKPLEDITCNEKQDAIFECELSHDEVETSWFRDGAKIIKSGQIIMESDGRIARLIIKNVNQEDDDQCDIQCRAEDAVTSAILTVKPTILEILDPLDEKYLCPEGEEFTFQVRVSQPGVAGEWYMNGNQIRRSVDVEIKPAKGDVHKIVFKRMHKGLMGQLKFRITKNGASCQSNIKVKGPDCKVVQKLPEELMGQAGQPMVFEVKLNRAPDQDASGWKKDGVFIDPFDPKYKVEEKDGGKHQRLIIPKPDPTDAGFYAFDTGDEETVCKALVKEQDAIFDEKLPSELKLKTEQENAKLQCSTNIAKNVELKWTKDGVEVTGDDYERIDEGCVHILQIKQVGSEHAGRYQCELVKSGDKTYCNVAVEDSPFQSDPVTKSIFVGESAEFEVMVKDNASKVIWSVNGKTGESRFEDSDSGFTRKFKVSSAELSDNGPIVAVVEGRESKPVTCDFNVYDHLIVTKKPENWSGKEKAEVTMVAEVNKNAKVTWYNNKRAISPDDEKYTMASEGCVHSIKFNATKEDDGATIEATFGAELDEYVSTSASLDVACGMSPAKIDVGDADREIVRGERAEIAFDLRGKPEPEITVTNQDRNKEQTVVQSEEVKIQKLIVIESVTNEDAGTYTIVAKNSEGSDNAALHVRVVARPDAPEGITVTKMTNDACGFCWKAPIETGGLPIIMYEIGWRYAEDEAWTEVNTKDETTNYFLMGLKKDSAIELKVAAVNRAGTGAWSEQVGPHKVSDGVFPPGYPVNVKVDKAGVTAKAVPMTWDEPASDGGAPVTGYEIEKQLDGMDGWEPCGKTADKKFTVEDPAVKDGKAYRFRVKAVNEAGVSGGSEPTEMINVEDPNMRPGAPSKVHADNPSTDSIDVSWKVPPSEQPITGYVLEKLKSGATEWEKCGSASGDQQAITVVELEAGTAYNFRCFAQNESGMSHPSEMSNACTTLDGAAPDVEPQLIPEQTHYQANRGEPFNAKVKVLGRPQCEVEWKRGSEAWFEYARYGGGFAQISIPAAQGTDSGEYTVTATNRAGSASATITVQIIDVPAEPVNLEVKPQNGGICFSWNAPKNDGGEQIAGYVVEYKDAESDWTEGANPVDCEHVFDDLPKGGSFKFRVAAYNKIGQGAFAEFGNEVGTAGGVVTNLHVTSTTDDSVSLAWDAPKNEKVTAALGYTVERLGEGMDPSLWVVHNPGSPAKSCKYTCNHLEFMSRWQFRVKCISEFGPGEPCEPTDWVTVEMDKTPPTVDLWEGAEDGLSVKVTQNRMIMPAKITGRPQPEVSWVKGDYPLSVDSRVSIANTDKMSTFTMADLTRGDSGEYTVIAENENGTAEKKVMVNVMDTPAAPEDFDISDITNKSAVLVWKAPLDDGGTPIRNYCVEKREVGRSVWGKITSEIAPDVTTFEVTRLLEGREYEFRVSARNDLGLGEGALSAPIIANYLFEVPEQCDPPTILETSITKSGMTAKWNAPEFDGGSPVTGYWLEMSNPDSTRWSKVNRKPIEAGKRTYKVANLKEGREYIFRVCAENLAGRGAWSDPSEPECALDPLAPPGRPGKPEVLAVGDTTASLKWKAPKEGVESIEHYVLEMRKRPQTDMEAEREAAAAAEAERKMKAMTWISRLPEYKEVEIAAPEIVLQVELNEGINDKIHWKKDGQRLKQGNGIEFISEGNIRILKITKTVSESDQGTYTAKVGGKKTECQVSVSLFMNDNNNVNSNNNISKLKLEEPKFNVESAFLTFEPKQQRDHFEAGPIECPPVDEYQTTETAMDACRAAVNANCPTQSSASCDKKWDCGAQRDSETIDSEYELNPCPNGKQNSQTMPQKETRNEKSDMKPP